VGSRGISVYLVTIINQNLSTKVKSDISVRLRFCAGKFAFIILNTKDPERLPKVVPRI